MPSEPSNAQQSPPTTMSQSIPTLHSQHNPTETCHQASARPLGASIRAAHTVPRDVTAPGVSNPRLGGRSAHAFDDARRTPRQIIVESPCTSHAHLLFSPGRDTRDRANGRQLEHLFRPGGVRPGCCIGRADATDGDVFLVLSGFWVYEVDLPGVIPTRRWHE
ncbi:hypothetical protein CTRI78_v010196 [Colletotrichum trifolii]|uniref:Uncharacterized protein n=1 Tax=Colletotrichum trifolii TaxID=5466 RepID=A0A4V3HU03_COLTR|nr:hypothetical protein CTRI78_v010196 [Colletotrichum trifolii]